MSGAPTADRMGDYQRLLDILAAMESCAVAFSGGLDSTFLLAAAAVAVGERVLAVTAVSDYMPEAEIAEARELARGLGARHLLFEIPFPDALRLNPRNRCYLCKREIFRRIQEESRGQGIDHVVEGTNIDDLGEDRPGLRALKELGIRSPLVEAGFAKEEIRRRSKRLGLPTWDKPAYACLMTRLPFDAPVTREALARVEKAESFLRERGFRALRVRSHGGLARIEVAREERSRLFDEDLLDSVAAELKALGFLYVTFDLQGYRTGSMTEGRKTNVPDAP